MPVAVGQITSDINVVGSSAEYRKVLTGAGAPRLEEAVESLSHAFGTAQGRTRLEVLSKAWQWRVANRPDDMVLRTLIFSTATTRSGRRSSHVALELRVGTSILDCALLTPGYEEAIEIKSGLDSTARLADQLRNYCAAFPRVTLLGDERSSARLTRFADKHRVGLVVAHRDGGSWTLESVRQGEAKWECVQLRFVLSMLRTSEIIALARAVVGEGFSPTPVTMFDEALSALSEIPTEEAASLAYAAIRSRRRLSNRILTRDIPLPIRASIAAINPRPEQLSDLRDWLSVEV